MREPLGWMLRLGHRCTPAEIRGAFANAARGPALDEWDPPAWLLPHQVDAARRLAGSLEAFGGALCADAVGLGKTYVGLALATRYRRVAAVVPAVLTDQWSRRAAAYGISLTIVSHEALSRGSPVPRADLTIVDEAHRFRNPATRRYGALSHRHPGDRLLLLSATPVVNRAGDLAALLRLFLADNGLAVLGVPSLEAALSRRDHAGIALASSALTVARSHSIAAVAMPVPLDAPVECPPPVAQPALDLLIARIDELRFPTFADHTAAGLLRLHLRYRLASSRAAALETLRRHLQYLECALDAAHRGERLQRSAMTILREEAEGQLELDLVLQHAAALDGSEISAERDRVVAALAEIAALPEGGPKPARLIELLAARGGRKTIVFTAAISTARAIAREMGWREAAVVSGGGAWIASGRIPVAEALALFAPVARGAPPPGPARHVTTLIATDLASEGLDLQDADAVVHYDLPWTPVRLEQRLGRIARLGSRHARVAVHWFAPPPELDRGLTLRRRLAGKRATQRSLAVPEWREHLAAEPAPPGPPRFAVVAGPPAAAFALSWRVGRDSFPEILLLKGPETRAVRTPQETGALLDQLLSAPASVAADPPRGWMDGLRQVIGTRLALLDRAPQDGGTRALIRLLVRHAKQVVRVRDAARLATIDRALEKLLAGVRPGLLDQLRNAVPRQNGRRSLDAWIVSQGGPRGAASVTLQAALFGEGTR